MAIFALTYKTNRRDMTFRRMVTSFSDVTCNLIGPYLLFSFHIDSAMFRAICQGY